MEKVAQTYVHCHAENRQLGSTGSPARSSATTWGRCEWEGGDIRIIMADALLNRRNQHNTGKHFSSN